MTNGGEEQKQTVKINQALQEVKKALATKDQSRDQEPLKAEQIEDRKSDRKLKKLYAKWFIGILIFQLVLLNLVIILAGADKLTFDEWELNIYVTATIAEIFGVVLVITKNLFPQK